MRSYQLSTLNKRTTWPGNRFTVFLASMLCLLFLQTNLTAQVNKDLPIIKAERVNDREVNYDRPSYITPDIMRIPNGMSVKAYQNSKNSFNQSAARGSNDIAANPDLSSTIACTSLDVIFVLDESNSIDATEAASVRAGALALANALNGSGANLRIIEFNTTSSIVNLGGSLVNATFIANLTSYLSGASGYLGQKYYPTSTSNCVGWTNWEDALEDVQATSGNLVLFFTDGNPTAYNSSGSCGVRTPNDDSYSEATALSRAIAEANIVKGQGKHMFAIGVGSDLNVDNIKAISGTDNFAVTPNIFTDDYSVSDFAGLAANLTAAVNVICGTTLTIDKTVNPTGVCANGNVTFTITVTNTGGSYNYVAQNVVLTDVFPNGFSNLQIVLPAPAGASITGNTLTYSKASLAANQSMTIQMTAHVGVPPGNFNNVASAVASNADMVQDNAPVSVGYATATDVKSACESYTWINGVTYYSSTNTPTKLFPGGSSAGCDSLVTLNLTITPKPLQPKIECYQTATFNPSTCSWMVTGTMPVQPTLACYQTASFNELTCVWDVAGTQPAQPETACYQTATFNNESCSWNVSGTMPVQPETACYEVATFNTASCSWDVTGIQPSQPSIACYQVASFNTASCSWDVTGSQPAQPETACYESAFFNTQSCLWEVSGTMPVQPETACYEIASFNTTSCSWDVTGTMPAQPETACYEIASFNTASCSWDVTGTMPAQPETACYEIASFNTSSCAWNVTGTMPAQPEVACYEVATFNTASCSWDVTGTMPAQPEVACYEVASFNTASCAWDVTGKMPVQPEVACYEIASFSTESCSWDVTGTMPAQPEVACYEVASFNTTSCSWDVTGIQPTQPSIACYQVASFNTASCSWDVTGSQPAQPETACYESAFFNTQSCLWEVSGTMPVQPATACYEIATFNTESCSWNVTGTMPVQPETACYEIASFNTESCSWDVTGTQPEEPVTSCYEYATFNSQTCTWDINGGIPPQPQVACYQTATFNTASCSWDVTGTMPVQPETACYEIASFNTESCSWNVTGTMPAQPEVACYEIASFNTESCSWNVTGTMPAQPEVACYEVASFNTSSCAWDVTGTMPVQPEVACYEIASFSTESCSWNVTGEMPAQPEVACYEVATFNAASCSWSVSGTMPVQPEVACYEVATFNATTCIWDVTGEPNAPIVTEASVCDSYTWAVTGVTYNATGLYSYSSDCQNFELYLTVNHSSAVTNLFINMNEGDYYVFNGLNLSTAGTYEASFVNEVGCDSLVILVLTVNPPVVEGCLGATVVSVNQGLRKDGNPVRAERSIPSRVLGAPDAQNPAIYAPQQYFFSLGFGGSIEIDFGYNIANGPGNDVKIWESSASVNAEQARIEVSQDGLGYVSIGTVAQGGEVDFGGAFSDYIRFVRIVDISNPAQFANNDVTDGYDVDAVECIHGRYVQPSCVGVEVVSVIQGKQANGADVPAVRSDVNNALDLPVAAPVGVVDFYSLGFGGEITIAFAGPVANGPGADIRIVETTWNYTCAQYPETAEVFASQDGLNYIPLGSTCQSGEFDLGVLSWAQFIKIMDVSNPALFPADADGYDLNGIECLNGSPENPGDDGLVPCVMTKILSYNPGTQKNGAAINANRNNPNKALGAPEGNDTYNFVSLGFGGSIELGFDYVVFNNAGNDIKVIETSFGNPSCTNYPEHSLVAASKDGLSWTDLGELCLDGSIDLGSMTYAQFVRITDISNAGSSRFGGSADGFDVDAVVAIGNCYNTPARLAQDNTTTPDEALEMSMFPNPADDFTVIGINGTVSGDKINVEVFDAAGRLVQSQSINATDNTTNHRLDVSSYAKGVYMIVVSTGSERFVQRLVK